MAREVIIGIGVSETANAQDAVRLAEELLSGALKDVAVIAVATIFGRAEQKSVQEFAGYFGVPVLVFDAAALERETPRLKNPSESLFERIGCHGVAEAAALAAAGPNGSLVVEKTKRGNATLAIAEIPVSR